MKKITLSLFFIVLSYFGFGQITLNGQVKNAKTYVAINSAFVKLKNATESYQISTTPNGSFEMNDIIPGTYQITISHIGYKQYVDSITLEANISNPFFILPDVAYLDAAIISVIRARDNTPVAFTNLSKKEIQQLDQSKDFPFLLNMTPSTVVSSDAGNGVGYTGIRIRGIDPTRVNITINGIPLNDGESQGVYWVNLPDLASNTQNVQIQRGVGTSTNGPAAFGASVNIRTNDLSEDKYVSTQFGLGSFNTQRLSGAIGSGRLKNNWAFEARASLISSDGFIDRASSNLRSANLTAAKYWAKSVFKANIMLGKERTYQAWWGIPEPTFYNNIAEENRYITQLYLNGNEIANLQSSNSQTYNYYTYENEVDNYNQNHYQLFFDHEFSSNLKLNTALYSTTGKGYFEQYKTDENFADYGIEPHRIGTVSIPNGDVIRRRWLDNTLFGGLAGINYAKKTYDLSIGGGFSSYSGRHLGNAIATEFTAYEAINNIYYDNDASKLDGNIYAKITANLNNFVPYVDLQMRTINYQFEGLNDSLDFSQQQVDYLFFNPKIGVSYLTPKTVFYAMYAMANREPVRDDFRDNKNSEWPSAELLNNTEFGLKFKDGRTLVNANFYIMDYTNQLVLTGAVNDVGEAIRTNVESSFRRGIELEFQTPLSKRWQFGMNSTFSQNKIEEFTETVFEWDNTYSAYTYEHVITDISFSPNLISAGMLSFKASQNFSLNITTKYVGKQYLDNTQNENRSLDPFTVMDFSMQYASREIKGLKDLTIGVFVNNLLNEKYAPNGYTFSGILNGSRADFNYLYPMAGTNWMFKISTTL